MASLLYLNPQLAAYCNVSTVSDALTVRASWGANLPNTIPQAPPDFSAEGYLIVNRERAPTGDINRAIRGALAAQGLTMRGNNFLPTIARAIEPTASNTFRFASPPPPNISVRAGDRLKILGFEPDRPTKTFVVTVIADAGGSNNGEFTVAEPVGPADPARGSLTYVLVGPDVVDAKRTALIDAARVIAQDSNADPLPTSVITASDFDAQLYSTLYANAQAMTSHEAYLDYLDKFAAGVYRMRVGDDFAPTAYRPDAGNNLSSMVITQNLTLSHGAVMTWGSYVLAGVRSNAGPRPALANASQQAVTLMTEGATKTYIELRVAEAAVDLNSAMTSNIAASLSNSGMATVTTSNLTIGTVTLACPTPGNLAVSGAADVHCSGTVTAKQFLALSDGRLKRDVTVESGRRGRGDLRRLARIAIARYRFFDAQEDNVKTSRKRGVIAQQLERVLPGAVTESWRWTALGAGALAGDGRSVLLPHGAPPVTRPGARMRVQCTTCLAPQERTVVRIAHPGRPRSSSRAELDAPVRGCACGPPPAAAGGVQLSVLHAAKTVDYEHLVVVMLSALKFLARRRFPVRAALALARSPKPKVAEKQT